MKVDLLMVLSGVFLLVVACTLKLRTDGELTIKHVIEVPLLESDASCDASDAGDAE